MDDARLPEPEPSGALVPPPTYPPTALATAAPLPPRRWARRLRSTRAARRARDRPHARRARSGRRLDRRRGRAALSVAARTPLERLRALCLAFPEAHEVEAWGEPTFRVKNKLFAMYASSDTHHGAGRPGVWIKSAAVTQDMLVRAEPARYFVPPVRRQERMGRRLPRQAARLGDARRSAPRRATASPRRRSCPRSMPTAGQSRR